MRQLSFAMALSVISLPAMAQISCPQLVVSDLQAHAMAAPIPAPFTEITGLARNVGNQTLRNMSLTFNLLDDSGTVVGNAYANGNNLEAGQSWRFSASATVPYSKFKLSGTLCP